MKDAILAALVSELLRQSNEDRHSTPFLDLDDVRDALVDGRVDLEALACAVEKAIEPTRGEPAA